jgi:hypothetical protein
LEKRRASPKGYVGEKKPFLENKFLEYPEKGNILLVGRDALVLYERI